jgi:hypothetical protein
MTKKRFIALLFALANFLVPPGAVYLQVTLSDGAAVQAMHRTITPAMRVIPAVLPARPSDSAEPAMVL